MADAAVIDDVQVVIGSDLRDQSRPVMRDPADRMAPFGQPVKQFAVERLHSLVPAQNGGGQMKDETRHRVRQSMSDQGQGLVSLAAA